ncbi:FAD synthetase family protein [Spiroplasma endosymbiont of Diplazon laetatorius]|uniref:FAD synthetase family protein n=1 Tax=Spiroplasma endosymbiont of Diplazon laetatorius TaxID=3066322 RepID=UPI0030D4414B
MIKIETLLKEEEDFNFNFEGNVVCIGFFDGVHLMHKKIIEETKKISQQENLNWSIITFSEKVLDFINGTKNNFQLKEKKYSFFEEKFNPDYLFEIKVNEDTIKKTPEQFCEFLKNNLKVKKIIVGSDFRFGYKGEGDIEFLKKYFGKENSIIFERDQNVSTTLIRKSITEGNVEKIKKILDSDFKVNLKKIDLNKYIINDFNTLFAKKMYDVKIENSTKTIEIDNNIIFFESEKDELEMEFL